MDGMDEKELRRQRVKFGLKNEQDAFKMKKALFLLVKHQVHPFITHLLAPHWQAFYQKEADEIMERRIKRANIRAEYRATRREIRRRKKEKEHAVLSKSNVLSDVHLMRSFF